MTAGRPARPLRSDAAHNRERLLEAALTAVRREGQGVPLATIAADAGVGVGTLYRHFPSRAALLTALEMRAYAVVVASLDAATAEADSGAGGVASFLHRTVHTRDQLFLPWHGAPATAGPEDARWRREIRARVGVLLERGRADGTLAADLVPSDVIVFAALLAQPLPTVEDWDAVATDQIRLFLRGVAGPRA